MSEVLEKLPDGWRVIGTVGTAPLGTVWACNGKSRFAPGYESALVREDADGIPKRAPRQDDETDGGLRLEIRDAQGEKERMQQGDESALLREGEEGKRVAWSDSPDGRYKMQQLARHGMVTRILSDIAFDVQVCKLEGWDVYEYPTMICEAVAGWSL